MTALDSVTQGAARSERDRPTWWRAVAWLQRLLTIAAVVGLVWLIVLATMETFLRFDTDALAIDTPGVDWLPVPSLLLLGGVGLSLLIALIVRLPASVGAKRRARRVRQAMRSGVEGVAETEVFEPLNTVLDNYRALHQLLDLAAGGRSERPTPFQV